MDVLLLVLNLGGTFVFALSSAMRCVARRLDIFGVSVLAFLAGNVGGILRDLLIGAVPHVQIQQDRYSTASLVAALFVFLFIAFGQYTIVTILNRLRMIKSYSTAPIERLADNDLTLIKQLLDIGTRTLMVSMVETRAQAESFVAATRYAPTGFTRHGCWGNSGRFLPLL